MEYLAYAEFLRRAGLSAAADSCLLHDGGYIMFDKNAFARQLWLLCGN